jgi:AAA family ATP:ADP antiporter
VYRGGDAASGWLSVGLTALGAGFGLVALVIVPFAGLWGWLCLWLARHQEKQVESKKVEGSFHEPH